MFGATGSVGQSALDLVARDADAYDVVALTGADMPAGGATVSIAATGDLALDGNAIARTELDAALARMLTANPDLRVRLNAHRDAELRHVLPLVGATEAMGVRDVVLVVTPADPP